MYNLEFIQEQRLNEILIWREFEKQFNAEYIASGRGPHQYITNVRAQSIDVQFSQTEQTDDNR